MSTAALPVIRPPRPIDPLEQVGKVLSLKSLLQGQQLRDEQTKGAQLENQHKTYEMGATKALNQSFQNAVKTGDDGTPQIDSKSISDSLVQSGYGSQVPGILKHITDFNKAQVDFRKGVADLQEHNANLLGSAANAIKSANYDPRVAHTVLDSFPDSPQIRNIRQTIDTDPQQFKGLVDTALANSQKQQEMAINKRRAAAAEWKQDPGTGMLINVADGSVKGGGVNPRAVDQLNGMIGRVFPDKPEYQLQSNPTPKDFDRVAKLMEFEVRREDNKTQREVINGIREQMIGMREDQVLNHSYEYNNTELQKNRAAVDQLAARVGRIKDTLQQKNPQADALVPPELLTVLAGGQGSGLRMNEAEISRIVGGRSEWEELKAKINHWRLNPEEAVSITDAQRGQMSRLVDVVADRILRKQQIFDDAKGKLIGATSVTAHRKVVADAEKGLTAIDTEAFSDKKSTTPAASGAAAAPKPGSSAKPWDNEPDLKIGSE